MVMTAGTGSRYVHQSARRPTDPIVDRFRLVAIRMWADCQKTKCGKFGSVGRKVHQVRRKLFANELIERLVRIESSDYVYDAQIN